MSDIFILHPILRGRILNMKRFLAVFLVVSILIGMVSASGSNEVTADNGTVSINVYWWGNQVRNDLTQKAINLYMEENPGVVINAEFADWSGYWDRLSATAAGGNMPDVVQMDYAYLDSYVKNGLITDLTPYIESGAIDTSAIPDSVLASGIVDGKVYGISLGNSAIMMSYDKAVADAAGVEVPIDITLNQLYEIGAEIYEKTGVRTYFDGGINMLKMIARNSDSYMFAELAAGDDTSARRFFEEVKRFQDAPFAISPDILVEKNADIVELKPILDGTSWNDFSGVNQYVAICNAADRDLVMTMYPKTDDSVKEAMYLQPSQYFTIAETSEYKDEAAAFVDWFINSEEANLILMGERGTPANTEVAAVLSESVDERTKVVFDFMDEVSAIAVPLDPPDPQGRGEIEAILKSAVEELRFGAITVDEATEEFVARAQQILNEG